MTCHEIEPRLDDYVDGALSGTDREAVETHLSACQACRGVVGELRSLLTTASALPREEQPARDLWPGVRSALESEGAGGGGKVVVGPWRRPALLAVAAVFLVVVSVSVTLVIQKRLGGAPAVTAQEVTTPEAGAPPAALASFRAAEPEYIRASDELMALYDRSRDQLAPETVAAVEKNLDIINQAITDARAALEADPGNRRLGHVATAMYERKVDLLRHLTRLSVPGLQG